MPQPQKNNPHFTHFIGIDWSGAKGSRHKGLVVAICEAGNKTPSLVAPVSGHASWSRQELADWIKGGCGLECESKALIGIDAAFSIPFMDAGAYFPESEFVRTTAQDLWREIAETSQYEVDLFAGDFINRFAQHFQQVGGMKGKQYKRRMRHTETICIETGAGPCESIFNLVGASQVGKSALSTMNMLQQLRSNEDIIIWPFAAPDTGSLCLVEIYAALFAKLGGHKGKMKDSDTLNRVLQNLGSKPYLEKLPRKADDVTDALVTAGGLRKIANERKYWKPKELSSMVRRTEGWIFGIE